MEISRILIFSWKICQMKMVIKRIAYSTVTMMISLVWEERAEEEVLEKVCIKVSTGRRSRSLRV